MEPFQHAEYQQEDVHGIMLISIAANPSQLQHYIVYTIANQISELQGSIVS